MVNVIAGEKGTGKTKVMINKANELVKSEKGILVFIDPYDEHIYDLDKRVRYVSLVGNHVYNVETLIAFIDGMFSQNYDIDNVFIDAVNMIVKEETDKLNIMFDKIDEISQKYNVDFNISVTCDHENIPNYLKKYVA